MVEIANNPPQGLADREKDTLDRLVLTYITKFYSLQEKYPNPKDYAEDRLLNKLESDSSLAFCHTLLFVVDLPSGTLFTPKVLNKKLAEEIPASFQSSSAAKNKTMMDESQTKFLVSRALREAVLEPLEKEGILLQQHDKDGAKEYGPPGKKPSAGVGVYDRGGRHSYYMTNQDMESLKQVMEKPQAVDYLFDKIMKSGLALKINRYMMLVVLHLMKLSGEMGIIRLINIGASADHARLNQEDINLLKAINKILQKLDDSKLSELADILACRLTEMKDYYNVMLRILGFMKL